MVGVQFVIGHFQLQWNRTMNTLGYVKQSDRGNDLFFIS